MHPHEVRDLVHDGEPVTDLGRPGRAPAHERIDDAPAVVDLDHDVVIGRVVDLGYPEDGAAEHGLTFYRGRYGSTRD